VPERRNAIAWHRDRPVATARTQQELELRCDAHLRFWPVHPTSIPGAAGVITSERVPGGDTGTVNSDPFDLQRFVAAQDTAGTYDQAVSELRRGLKTSHWMWFVFPQIAGLGQSSTSRMYAISSLAEARAYLAHPILGPRLQHCAELVCNVQDRSAEQIFGGIDAQKLRSSMTLFLHADPTAHAFRQVLDQYFGGIPDAATQQRI
jgi:uncharacterized protein (DUF1810 family)